MATERDLELLDDYLANRLKGEEKVSFEQRIQADPELRNEMQLQQHLVTGIRKARASELKTMLNNIPLSSIPQSGASAVAKFAMGGLIAGAVITGVYFLSKEEPEEKEPVTEQKIPVQADSNSEKISSAPEEPKPTQTETSTEEKKETAAVQSKTKKPAANKQTTSEVTQPQIEVFDPTDEAEGTGSHINQSESKPSNVGRAEPSIAVSVDKNHREFGFHYQFKDEKLFLYGPFESNLYEIMEFFSEEKRTIFLFYKDAYYLLKEDGSDIKPLKEITDPILVRKLQESRGK